MCSHKSIIRDICLLVYEADKCSDNNQRFI